jgi:hypothetical protein
LCLSIGPYEGGKADATFSFKDEDFVKVALGKMNPQIAFMRFDISTRDLFPFFFLRFDFSLFIHSLVSVVVAYEYRGAMKIKGSLSAAQKFTPDIFPKPSKM